MASIVEFFDSDYWRGVTPSDLYRPFGLLFVYTERLLFGSWTLAYRVVSVLLHFAACLLIWRLFAREAGERVAGFAAVIFAVHPIHAEALFTVYGQLDLLAAVLVLCALQAAARRV